MYRQVGDLMLDKHGLAKHGLLIRHLVMPRDIAGTRKVMNWIAQELSATTYVNLMRQYDLAGKVTGQEYAEIGRRVTRAEYEQALDEAVEAFGAWTPEWIASQGTLRLDR
jgi:putative pyruvate formate lyase activating enzyme